LVKSKPYLFALQLENAFAKNHTFLQKIFRLKKCTKKPWNTWFHS